MVLLFALELALLLSEDLVLVAVVEALEKLLAVRLASMSSMDVQLPYRSIIAHRGWRVSIPEKKTPRSPPLIPKCTSPLAVT